jgi:hypothetical protein
MSSSGGSVAKKKKKDWPDFPDPKSISGVMWKTPMPPEMRLFYGLGSMILGAAAMRFAPRAAVEKILPVLVSAWTPPPGFQALPFRSAHPEALERIETRIDERQLGRSEVIREIANPKKN